MRHFKQTMDGSNNADSAFFDKELAASQVMGIIKVGKV
jgi:hypothetical protein